MIKGIIQNNMTKKFKITQSDDGHYNLFLNGWIRASTDGSFGAPLLPQQLINSQKNTVELEVRRGYVNIYKETIPANIKPYFFNEYGHYEGFLIKDGGVVLAVEKTKIELACDKKYKPVEDILSPSELLAMKEAYLTGAKEMEKGMYSEEEVCQLIEEFVKDNEQVKGDLIDDYQTRKEWFETFKKQ